MILILIFILVLSIYFAYRGARTEDFVRELGEKILRAITYYKWHNDEEKALKVSKLIEKYDFRVMVFSFKPIKLEYWFTDEEIDLLNYKKF